MLELCDVGTEISNFVSWFPGVNFDYYPKSCDVIIVEPVAEFKDSITKELKKVSI